MIGMDERIFPCGPDVRGPHHMALGKLAPKVDVPTFLRLMRESRGFSRTDLVVRLRIGERTLAEIENCESPMRSLELTAALADLLGVGRVMLAMMALRDYEAQRGGWS
ncbi:helix-turn-helix domain-containing protein [Amycolatopsis sp. cg5]|uniref:helix-turn-helix domain-containing protein n=1 Tax=Amycolatopsis sp. cg5 TaxID=3238802 RepID=UPI0035237387